MQGNKITGFRDEVLLGKKTIESVYPKYPILRFYFNKKDEIQTIDYHFHV